MEGGLPFISSGDADQMICMPEINLGVDPCNTQGIQEVGDSGNWSGLSS
jgi:hypothetical protein